MDKKPPSRRSLRWADNGPLGQTLNADGTRGPCPVPGPDLSARARELSPHIPFGIGRRAFPGMSLCLFTQVFIY